MPEVHGLHRRPHVPDSDLETPLAACIICSSVELDPTRVLAQSDPDVRYLSCARCHARFAERQPTEGFLTAYYQPSTYAGTVARNRVKARRLARRCLSKDAVDRLSSQERIDILDFGGGNGLLALELREMLGASRCNVTVVELHERQDFEDVRYRNIAWLDAQRPGSFSVVLANAVIEHLKQPGEVLRMLYRVCRQDGYLYVRTPNLFPLARLKPSFLIYPEHLADLGPRFFSALPDACQWDLVPVYSRTCQTDTMLRESVTASIAGSLLKTPARLETWLRKHLKIGGPVRYECSGGWEVLFRKSGSSSRGER